MANILLMLISLTENAFSKLKTGRGNLIGQVEKLKVISNIKPKKELENNLVENAMGDNE
ncbi:hypothetical protein ACP8HZ_03180 [Francisella noatunensis]